MPNKDTDDYLSLSTVSNVPYINSVGGGGLKIATDGGDIELNSNLNNNIICKGSGSATYCYLNAVGGSYDGAGSPILSLAINNDTSNYARLYPTTSGLYLWFGGTVTKDFIPFDSNQYNIGSSSSKWKNGYIVNAWTVGDLVFNYDGSNYRIIEAEKLTNNKSHGLMYVMGDKAVMWIEPDGKLHTTQEIDTTWDGITGLSFDEDGGVYKDNEIVRYPVVGSGNETYLSPVFLEDGKKEFKGDDRLQLSKANQLKNQKQRPRP